jgi:ATP-dependent DNA ligase
VRNKCGPQPALALRPQCWGQVAAELNKRIAHRGIWVEPELVAEIEYRAKSAEGKVRHPFFKGLREDL